MTVAKALVSIFFQHSYIPTKILSDLGTSFVAELVHELSRLLEIQLEHASLKHPQTIGVVERSHAALKRIWKLNTDEKWTAWCRYVDLATFIHNTSYHSSIGCTPSSLFHGREPIKPIDLSFRSHALAQKELTSDYLVDLQDSLLEQFSHTKLRLLDAYHKYRTYDDKKAAAKPLNIPEEQKKDPVIIKVMEWIENGCTDDLTYASFELKKYHKHLMRLHIQKGILVRQFFDDIGEISHSQVCVPKHLRKEVIYRIHNSPTGGHLGIVRTAKEFRKRFYFPGFSEYSIDYIKNCLSCSTLKRVTKKNSCTHHFNQFHQNNFFRVT